MVSLKNRNFDVYRFLPVIGYKYRIAILNKFSGTEKDKTLSCQGGRGYIRLFLCNDNLNEKNQI